MKTLYTKNHTLLSKLSALFLSFLLLGGMIQAQTTFTTISDGNFNDGSIWSTDGGVTPCSCVPLTELPGVHIANLGNLEINHNVALIQNTIIMGTGMIVNVNAPNGAFNGNFSLDVRNGVLNNFNSISVTGMTIFNGGFLRNMGQLTVSPGNLVNAFQGRMDLSGNVTVPNGDLVNDGMIDIRSNATVVVGGNLTNNEFINMEPAGCVNVTADVNNVGNIVLVNGPGNAYIQSGSNITNNSLWDTDVDYCAGGTAVGLSHSANCSNCGILPVELIGFEAEMDNGQVILSWETAEEINNSFFTVQRSADGEDFEAMTTVQSTSPVQGKVYQTFDNAPYYGISYYRLTQTDQDGTTRTLETVMVNNADDAEQHFNAFPNPFKETIRVTTFGMEGAAVTIQVLDLSGREIARKDIDNTADFSVYEIQPGTDLPTGMYIVRVTGKNITESFKLFH